jgi:hypothetical protein
MIEWIFERLGLVIFLVIFISQVVRAILRSRKAQAEHEAQHDESAAARRTREIQEEIRRRVAERRGELSPTHAEPPVTREIEARPIPRPQTTQMPEPFGGPLGRMLEELQRRTQPQTVPPPPPLSEYSNSAELERQQRITEELRVLEESRVVAQRRADYTEEQAQVAAESESSLRAGARERLLGDLSDPQSLRRAFVLREVLGTPVGLR